MDISLNKDIFIDYIQELLTITDEVQYVDIIEVESFILSCKAALYAFKIVVKRIDVLCLHCKFLYKMPNQKKYYPMTGLPNIMLDIGLQNANTIEFTELAKIKKRKWIDLFANNKNIKNLKFHSENRSDDVKNLIKNLHKDAQLNTIEGFTNNFKEISKIGCTVENIKIELVEFKDFSNFFELDNINVSKSITFEYRFDEYELNKYNIDKIKPGFKNIKILKFENLSIDYINGTDDDMEDDLDDDDLSYFMKSFNLNNYEKIFPQLESVYFNFGILSAFKIKKNYGDNIMIDDVNKMIKLFSKRLRDYNGKLKIFVHFYCYGNERNSIEKLLETLPDFEETGNNIQKTFAISSNIAVTVTILIFKR